jgi:SAM-dependent methyltransferase
MNSAIAQLQRPDSGGAESPLREATEAWRLLSTGHVDEGMRSALCALNRYASTAGGSANAEIAPLLQILRQNPFVARSCSRPYGYPGDPGLIDLALGWGPAQLGVSPLGCAMFEWMQRHSETFAALRSRTRYIARQIDQAAAQHQGATIVGLFGGHGRELQASRAFCDGQVSACLIDHDRRVLAQAAAPAEGCPGPGVLEAELAQILSGEIRLFDCSLVYLCGLAEHVPAHTLACLLEAVAGWLRPGGQIVVTAFDRLPEAGFLDIAADWRPRTLHASELRRLAGDIDDVAVHVDRDADCGLANLRLVRH